MKGKRNLNESCLRPLNTDTVNAQKLVQLFDLRHTNATKKQKTVGRRLSAALPALDSLPSLGNIYIHDELYQNCQSEARPKG